MNQDDTGIKGNKKKEQLVTKNNGTGGKQRIRMVWAFNANGRDTLPKEINNLVQTGNWKRGQPSELWKGAQEMTEAT